MSNKPVELVNYYDIFHVCVFILLIALACPAPWYHDNTIITLMYMNINQTQITTANGL